MFLLTQKNCNHLSMSEKKNTDSSRGNSRYVNQKSEVHDSPHIIDRVAKLDGYRYQMQKALTPEVH